MNWKKRIFSVMMVFVMLAGMLPVITPQTGAAYSSSDSVRLPENGVVAAIRYQESGTVKVKEYKPHTEDGMYALRSTVNQQLADAWNQAISWSDDGNKDLPANEKFSGIKFIELHLYVDWIAVNGSFGTGEYFDNGGLEVGDASSLLVDLHGNTIDRGATSIKQYGRVFDLQSIGSIFALTSTVPGEPGISGPEPSTVKGTVKGGYDTKGGAIWSAEDNLILLDNIHLTGNHAEKGGAIYHNHGAKLKAKNCEFSYNIAEKQGGAIRSDEHFAFERAYIELDDCVFHHNTSLDEGGAIYGMDLHFDTVNYANFSYAKNCVFYENYAAAKGGAIYLECDGILGLLGETLIYDNHAGDQGGGVFLEAYANDEAILALGDKAAVFSNTAGDPAASSDIHLDTGTTSDAQIHIFEGYDPDHPTGLRSEGDGQIAVNANGWPWPEDGFNFAGIHYSDFGNITQAQSLQYFYSNRADQWLEEKNDVDIKAEDLPSAKQIGKLLSFDATVSSSNSALNGMKPSFAEVNNSTHTVMLKFPVLEGTSLDLQVEAQLSGNAVPSPDPLTSLDLVEMENGHYRAYFKVGNGDADKPSYHYWTVDAVSETTYDEALAMQVTYDSTAVDFLITNPQDPFEAGWKLADEKVKDGKDVTVKLYRDWTASSGNFGSGEGFSEGRIALGYDKSSTLTLDLNGCTIDRALTTKGEDGQVFRLSSKAKLCITDSSAQGTGTITGGNNSGDGGAFYMTDNAQLTLNAGTISHNRCSGDGGGVHACDSSRFIMNGGTISDNSATHYEGRAGGGVFVTGSAHFIMNGGAITGNLSDKGHGIYGAKGGSGVTVAINGGTISGRTGLFDIGIYWAADDDAKLYLRGGSITDNHFGVYAVEGCTDPYVGGTIRIADNFEGDLVLESKEVDLNHDTSVPLSKGALIGVEIKDFDGEKDCISASGSKFASDSSQYFFARGIQFISDTYSVVCEDKGSGNNRYSLYLVRKDKIEDDSKADITALTFSNGVAATVDPSTHTVSATVHPDKYLTYRNIAVSDLSHTGSSVSPSHLFPRDYTVPQTFVVTAADGLTQQTWTVQALPSGGEWLRYRVDVDGGLTDCSSYYPGQTITLTADERENAEFVCWEISDGSATKIYTSPVCTFTMENQHLTAKAIFIETVSEVVVSVGELTPGETLADVAITATHNCGDGAFNAFTPVWKDGSGQTLSGETVIAANTPYFLHLELTPAGSHTVSSDVEALVNNEVFFSQVTEGKITVSGMLSSGEVNYASITVTDGTSPLPVYRYSLTKDGKLAAGETATFIPYDYYDAENEKSYRVSSVSGITDADSSTPGWQFTVTDPLTITVTYTELIPVGEVTLEKPALTPGAAMPSTMPVTSGAVNVVSLTWEPADTNAGYYTEYYGTVTLEAKDGYILNNIMSVTLDIDGDDVADTISYTSDLDGTLSVEFYACTEKDVLTGIALPDSITVSAGTDPSLPYMVDITTRGASATYAGVHWYDFGGFSADVPGTYTFTGEVYLPEHVELPADPTELGLTANGDLELSVTVSAPAPSDPPAPPVPSDPPTPSQTPCDGGANCPHRDFTDLDPETWSHKSVDYVLKNGLMSGYGNGRFAPYGVVTRQQVWMTLARISGQSPADMSEARAWAMETGISDGSNPTGAITRQQMMTMLYRYAVLAGYDVSVGTDSDLHSYTDAGLISEYALEAMQWACDNGIMSGYEDGTLKPTASTFRVYLAAFLHRFMTNVSK